MLCQLSYASEGLECRVIGGLAHAETIAHLKNITHREVNRKAARGLHRSHR